MPLLELENAFATFIIEQVSQRATPCLSSNDVAHREGADPVEGSFTFDFSQYTAAAAASATALVKFKASSNNQAPRTFVHLEKEARTHHDNILASQHDSKALNESLAMMEVDS